MMRRRDFLALAGCAGIGWPLATHAQQTDRMRLVGVLHTSGAESPDDQRFSAALDAGLRSLGWIEGRNLRVEHRWAGLKSDLYPVLARELVALAPDVIVASTTVTLAALQRESRAIPTVFTMVSDPVAQGFVASLAHPGGNTTGFTAFEFGIGGKWLGLLKEVAPDIARVMFMFNPTTSPQWQLFLSSLEAAAPSAGLPVVAAPVHTEAEVDSVFEGFARQPHGGMVIAADNFLQQHHELVIGSASRYRIPAIYGTSGWTSNGGLMSYGLDLADNWRRAASYVDRILKGEKPGELPIQQPNTFNLVLNMKTAKALELTIPLRLQAAADEVIE